MNREKVIERIFAELAAAERKHQGWPEDMIHAAAIVGEEAGELLQASIDHEYAGLCFDRLACEAAQTAAMGIRFLINLPDTQETTP